MNIVDWIVLFGTQAFIVIYGVWKLRENKDIHAYLLSNRESSWATIGISVIATQASAITFLSTPGQAFGDGMRFIQFYLAMPIAMVILCATAVPLYYKLKVYTAYEFLEKRFNLELRVLTTLLFLIQRSMSAGLSIYAPAIILSTVLGWSTGVLSTIIGLIVILYSVLGGNKAVNRTQKQQMFIILVGMFMAMCYLIMGIPKDISFADTFHIAGKMGKLNAIDFEFDPSDRYNIWSGLIGGLFLFLSYFGTDQSQVQRYLSGKSIKEIRLGLMMNGNYQSSYAVYQYSISVYFYFFSISLIPHPCILRLD